MRGPYSNGNEKDSQCELQEDGHETHPWLYGNLKRYLEGREVK